MTHTVRIEIRLNCCLAFANGSISRISNSWIETIVMAKIAIMNLVQNLFHLEARHTAV